MCVSTCVASDERSDLSGRWYPNFFPKIWRVSVEKSLFPAASLGRLILCLSPEATRLSLPAQLHLLHLKSLPQLALPGATQTMVKGVDRRRYLSPGIQRDIPRTWVCTWGPVPDSSGHFCSLTLLITEECAWGHWLLPVHSLETE